MDEDDIDMLSDSNEPNDSLAKALKEGNLEDVTRLLQNPGAIYILDRVYGDGVPDNNVLMDPTALTLATEYGHIECVRKILLDLGHEYYTFGCQRDRRFDDTIVTPDDYFAALILAFSKGYSEICQLLVEFRLFKAPDVADEYIDFISAARVSDFLEIETLFDELEEVDEFLKGWRGHNIVNMCLLYGCPISCLQHMLDFGISVNGWDYNGLTPLMSAIIGRNLECVKFLLENGADPYALQLKQCEFFLDDGTITYDKEKETDSPMKPSLFDCQQRYGPSALMYAAGMGHIPILKVMLEAAPNDLGTPGRIKKFEQGGPLVFAIAYSNIESVKLLLDNKSTRENMTSEPIVLAMNRGNMELFGLLLDNTHPSSKGYRNLMNGVIYSCTNTSNAQYMARLCKTIGDSVFEIDNGRCLYAAMDDNRFDLLEVLTKLPGFSVHTRYPITVSFDGTGATCFMYACDLRSVQLANMFYKMGALVNELDKYHRTPVLKAVRRKEVACLKYLLAVGADLHVVDKNGGTVFSAALAGKGACLEILLERKRLLEDDGITLKPVHIKSVMCAFHRFRDDGDPKKAPVSFKSARILMQYKLFNWEWFQNVDGKSIRSLVFNAVSSGVPPGTKGDYQNNQFMSPLALAVRFKDEDLIRYILANLYFLPSDYQYLLNLDIGNLNLEKQDRGMGVLCHRLTHQPLSLKAWCVLRVSESLVKSSDDLYFPEDRNSKVNGLVLPARLKDMLMFKTRVSNLCVSQWQHLGPKSKQGKGSSKGVDNANFDEIVMDGVNVEHFTLKKCKSRGCKCQGVGERVKPVTRARKVSASSSSQPHSDPPCCSS